MLWTHLLATWGTASAAWDSSTGNPFPSPLHPWFTSSDPPALTATSCVSVPEADTVRHREVSQHGGKQSVAESQTDASMPDAEPRG